MNTRSSPTDSVPTLFALAPQPGAAGASAGSTRLHPCDRSTSGRLCAGESRGFCRLPSSNIPVASAGHTVRASPSAPKGPFSLYRVVNDPQISPFQSGVANSRESTPFGLGPSVQEGSPKGAAATVRFQHLCLPGQNGPCHHNPPGSVFVVALRRDKRQFTHADGAEPPASTVLAPAHTVMHSARPALAESCSMPTILVGPVCTVISHTQSSIPRP